MQCVPDGETIARGDVVCGGGEEAVGHQHLKEEHQSHMAEAPRGVCMDGGGVEYSSRVGHAVEERPGEV